MRRLNTHDQRGVTLIELMIAISLVAILSGGLLTAMRTSLGTSERIKQRLTANRRAMNVQQMISSQISAAMPVAGVCISEDSTKPNAAVPFFFGTEASVRFVTSYSLAEGARGAPQIVEYQVLGSPNGHLRLAAAERPYTGPPSTAPFCQGGQMQPVSLPANALTLVDDLAACRFSYHPAYDNYVYRETPWIPNAVIPAWDARFQTLPAAVRIVFQQSGFQPSGFQPYGPSLNGLPLLEITAPIRADRNVMLQYGDAY